MIKTINNTAITLLIILALPVILSAQLPSYLPTNGLVAWYPFNGNANDESGNGNDGVVNGAVLTEDRFGSAQSAYSFNGALQNILKTNFPVTNGSLSISFWFNASNINNTMRIVTHNWNGNQGAFSTHLDQQSLIYGYFGFVTRDNSNIQYHLWNSSTTLSNEWHYVVAIASGEMNMLYLDGVLINSIPTPDLKSSVGTLFFGGDNSYPFFGCLDDIAIYNRALSASEVTALYTATATNTGGGTTTTSTAPPGIPYQAEVRNEIGEVLANANVNVRFTLHELTASGTVSYQETHAITTNELGLFASTIGAGTATQGTFASINWAQTTKFLQVEVDTGNGYITMGNQQLMSVPYALYAANAQPGPAGAQGPAGVDGQQGPEGAQGSQGSVGPQGLMGPNGLNSLIKTTSEPAGVNCSKGGVKIESGADLNSNGILEDNEVNSNMTKYVCDGSSSNAQSIADWKLPDGLVNITMINWDLATSQNVSTYNSYPYTVPAGKNLYIRSTTSSQAYNGCNPGIYCNGIQINNATCGGATNNQIYIVPAGSTITYNGGCSNGYGCSTAFATFTGFLVDASVTAIFQSSSIVVPTSQIFVAYSNTSLPSFYTAGQSVPANLNGYLISVQ